MVGITHPEVYPGNEAQRGLVLPWFVGNEAQRACLPTYPFHCWSTLLPVVNSV